MIDTIQGRLLRWAAGFLFIYSTILTLSPAVRERSWDVDYRFSHWIGFFVWLLLVSLGHRAILKYLPDRDPYLYPAALLLTGWGLLSVWRLDEAFGFRQTLWFTVSVLTFIFALRLPQDLNYLRRYKYILLTTGLIITAFTLIFGTNPSGFGPRLWLGCCGVYFQPSEPLKLLLVIYLAAYLADHYQLRLRTLPLLFPTIFVTGIALLLLLVQRDLGTASIFILLYTVIIYIVTGKRRVLLGTTAGLAMALAVGYISIDVIHIRVAGWLNPWIDPAGNAYQIIQSILAVANGGTIGRGVGLGSPSLVPVAISDFIYSAIAEETGLVGTVGLLALIWLILGRGMLASLQAPDRFRRYLAAGITIYLGLQSLLIIGGNLRLVPLTGVTLPFVSYGGSSLLTSFIALFLLMVIGGQSEVEPAPLADAKPYILLTSLLGLGLAATALTTAYWADFRGGDLLARTDNPRRAIADRYVPRGRLLDRDNQPINTTEGESSRYERVYDYPDLAPISGYTHPIYGQAGLEASLDEYLRGLQGNPASMIWWDHFLYGTPPPGLDVRLSIDLGLQARADELLGDHKGSLLLMNAQTGEILAMASHPTFDPNHLDEEGVALANDPSAPLLNRATQGQYPLGTALTPIIHAKFGNKQPGNNELMAFLETLGIFSTPDLAMPVSPGVKSDKLDEIRVNPLQVTLAASALSANGIIPAPRIAMAVDTPEQGWVVLPALGQPVEVLQAEAVSEAIPSFVKAGDPFWQHIGHGSTKGSVVTWLLAGTLPNWEGSPLALIIALEENNAPLAMSISEELFNSALNQ